jgi:hypothetical protein
MIYTWTTGYGEASAVNLFQTRSVDPNLVVPRIVDRVDVFFQHTPVGKFVTSESASSEAALGLWGHGNDGAIADLSNAAVVYHDLTSQAYASVGLIGHSGVILYYLYFIINADISLVYT